MQNVDTVIFVGPHIRREAIARFGWERWAEEKLVVISNYVDTQALDLPKSAGAQFNIGIVGIVPQRKRFDLAVDIIEKLGQQDERFHLYIKGKLPEEYPWMLNRAEEMQYYMEQMEKIKKSPLLRDAVHFDGWGSDMPEWYQKIGFILSVSDFESFHLSVAEGAASKGIPLMLKWEGAEEIYPEDWSYHTVDEIANAIVEIVKSGRFEEIAAARYAYAKQNFDIERIARLWLEVIEGD
jgi:glycosyltransferase involved in cell wall biosynthesis